MKTTYLYRLTAALALAALLQGCGFMVGAAAGGTAGYLLKDNGYSVRAPITPDASAPPATARQP